MVQFIKQQGASIVARSAVDLLINQLEQIATSFTNQARIFTIYANLKRTWKNLI